MQACCPAPSYPAGHKQSFCPWLFQHIQHCLLRLCTKISLDFLAVPEHDQGRDAHDTVLLRDLHLIVDIQLADLYIGGAWNGSWSTPIKIEVEDGTYKDFSFTTTGDSQFRFYAGSNGDDTTLWMGPSTNAFEATPGSQYVANGNTTQVYNVKGLGTYVIHVSKYDAEKKSVEFYYNQERNREALVYRFQF